MISPTMLSNNTLSFRQLIEFHPSGKVLMFEAKGFSEIIIGEIIAKTPYGFRRRRRDSGYGRFSKIQPGKMGPAPGRFELSKGILK